MNVLRNSFYLNSTPATYFITTVKSRGSMSVIVEWKITQGDSPNTLSPIFSSDAAFIWNLIFEIFKYFRDRIFNYTLSFRILNYLCNNSVQYDDLHFFQNMKTSLLNEHFYDCMIYLFFQERSYIWIFPSE